MTTIAAVALLPDVLPSEALALRFIAGLGLTSTLLGVLLLAGLFPYALAIVGILAVVGIRGPAFDSHSLAQAKKGPRYCSSSRRRRQRLCV